MPASQATLSVRVGSPLAGSKAISFAPVAAQTRLPSWVTPLILLVPAKEYSRTISAARTFAWGLVLPALLVIAGSLWRASMGAVETTLFERQRGGE